MKVLLGLSGGVDSSVAATLLQRSGAQVEALFMRNWDEDDGPCSADADRRDAVGICAQLDIPFHFRNFAAQYRERVFRHFLDEYQAGRTPNPDVTCNREIKFGVFLAAARELGADKIATGHYARVDRTHGRWRLLRAHDRNKDQSYFLHALNQDALAQTLFPIGELDKPQVRALARDAGLATSAKKDSTGICFIGERPFHRFLANYLPARPGRMLTPDGHDLGEHDGVMYYTLGQRGGLGIGGRHGAENTPWYVVGKDVTRNILYVAQGQHNHWLQSTRLRAQALTWIAGQPPGENFGCTAKIRYRQPDQDCRVTLHDGACEVEFDQPQRAVTPGQSVVFYAGEECLGGGVIAATDAAFGGMRQRAHGTHSASHPPLDLVPA